MRLLLDTDSFWKFGAAGLLEAAVDTVGVTMSECLRLPGFGSRK